MAKAVLRNAEMEHWQAQVGGAIERVQERSGLSLKEFAAKVKRNERQVARWFVGKEHPQLAPIFAVPAFRQLLVVALAELAGESVEITTAITIRRIA
jgi:hypothetical protein